MKRVKKPVFFVVLILIAVLVYTSLAGIYVNRGDFKDTVIKGVGDIRWGIDIRGGVEATFSPAGDIEAKPEELDSAKAIIERRMVDRNITDYEIYTDSSNNRIIVRFPWKSDEAGFNPEEAVEELSATALLTFREGMEYETTDYADDGSVIYKTPTGTTAETVILEGSDIASADFTMYQDENNVTQYAVSLEFSNAGTTKFAEATSRLVNQTISIWMDDVMISFPTVNDPITDGRGQISGGFTAEEAKELADLVEAGALPFALETSNFSSINPLLGMSSLDAMALAGIIAFIFIALLMIVMYRLPGAVAVISLAGQLGLTFAAISGYLDVFDSFTMTLPGIAGIILSIGMGVDANIITASRIREELRNGRSFDGAIQRGCSDSFWAVFDGNITILIVAIMLIGVFGPSNILSMIFGESATGAIYSFGYTLLVGTLGNFVMGMFASRLMIKSLSGFKFLRKPVLYGGAGK